MSNTITIKLKDDVNGEGLQSQNHIWNKHS